MRQTGRRDTAPELLIRRLLHRRGWRYLVDHRVDDSVRARADLLFSSLRVAVFVDGCFWHGCPRHATWPKANGSWWREKIESNVSRDRRSRARLRASGWTVLRVWEHEDPGVAAGRLDVALRKRRARGTTSRG